MEFVQSSSGLLIAGEGADERAVGALLRQHDPDLRLVPRIDPERECILWAVYRYRGTDHPAEFVCFWQTRDGIPLPLSSSVLDLVQQLDKNTSSATHDPDATNAQVRLERSKQKDRDYEAIRDDWLTPHGRPVLPRGQSLRRARDKRRARGEKC